MEILRNFSRETDAFTKLQLRLMAIQARSALARPINVAIGCEDIIDDIKRFDEEEAYGKFFKEIENSRK
jgi:hypothetical protein